MALGLSATTLLCSVSVAVARSSVLGSPGTQVVLGIAFLITVAGVVVGWRPAGAFVRVRRLVALLLGLAAGATAATAVGFFGGGEYAVIGIVLLQSAIFMVVVATRVHRSSTRPSRPSPGVS